MIDAAHLSEDRLLDLASGLTPAAESDRMVEHLAACPECEEKFRATCREVELARLRAPRAHARRVPRWAYGAAAALVLVVAGAALVPRLLDRSPSADPRAYWLPLEAEAVELRTGSPDLDDAALREAAEAYRRRDPAQVVRLLEGRVLPPAQDPLKIVLASAMVKTGDAAGARKVLEGLSVDTLPLPDRDRARWILVAALEAAGEERQAREVAEGLASRPGEFERAARRWLRKRA